MTIDTLFLLLVPTYLAIIAYGQIGARKRGLAPGMRAATGALRVLIPPVVVFAALVSTGNPFLVTRWEIVTLGMALVGAIVAVLTELIARRVGA